ncbi:MAG: hypothetical protein OEV49_03360 [candidate division Zixibacteria bacterium]|nr:hypothetical protein [candidate division Zixibacteria bacterium]MDH3936589.1 hypothetical protein [candidate division Zixibacteria bacterium]MDH4033472.1 hypothetical protein [candidate division Zixibacteria bacterium]
MIEQLLEAWRTNNRINLFLIDNISGDGMKCTLSKRGGRNVVRQFAHMHNNRVWQLESRARDLSKDLYKFETHEEPDRTKLKENFEDSCERVEAFLHDCLAQVPRRRCLKKGVISMLSYFIAHESHHRGNILLTLKECGHPLDQASRYAIWSWDKM